jgi:hypothetical protein
MRKPLALLLPTRPNQSSSSSSSSTSSAATTSTATATTSPPQRLQSLPQKGAYFIDCYYDYANTKTAPGHSTIGTGAYTDGHGIGSNEWWDLARNTDRPVSSVEDERYRLVGTFDDLPVPPAPGIDPKAPRVGSSPFNLNATTIGDEVRLATNGESKLFGVSLKDRAAILPSGQTANGAYWIDQANGRFVTSTYYMPQLPDWATKFNRGPRVAQAVKDAGLDSTTQFYAWSAAPRRPTATNSTSPKPSLTAKNSANTPPPTSSPSRSPPTTSSATSSAQTPTPNARWPSPRP